MTEQSLARPDNPFSLPPGAILGSNEPGEHYPPSELWNGLRHEREAWCLDRAFSGAQGEIETHTSLYRNLIEKLSEGERRELAIEYARTARIDTNTLHPRGRVELQALAHTVGSDDLIQRIQTLQRDEVMDFDSGRGFTLRITGFKKGRVDWRLQLDEDATPGDRARALDDFSAGLTEYLGKGLQAASEIQAGLAAKEHEAYSSEVFSWATEADQLTSFANNSELVQILAGVREGDSPAMARAKTIEGYIVFRPTMPRRIQRRRELPTGPESILTPRALCKRC